ncbi:hypothetical protein GW17_00042819 [Ensete ventricosum]|nr:hypothetical protein GW17_00042819 [Ensete ventricosum]RZS14009.1 hypothetical protein BHM03_00045660 [Ensete ventricosum]
MIIEGFLLRKSRNNQRISAPKSPKRKQIKRWRGDRWSGAGTYRDTASPRFLDRNRESTEDSSFLSAAGAIAGRRRTAVGIEAEREVEIPASENLNDPPPPFLLKSTESAHDKSGGATHVSWAPRTADATSRRALAPVRSMWCSRRPNRLTAERENLPVKPRCSCIRASVEKLPCFTGREEMSRICASSFEMAALTVVFFCIVREPIVYVNVENAEAEVSTQYEKRRQKCWIIEPPPLVFSCAWNQKSPTEEWFTQSVRSFLLKTHKTCCASFAVHFVATGILSNLRCSLNHAPTASAPRQQWPCLKEHCVAEVGI